MYKVIGTDWAAKRAVLNDNSGDAKELQLPAVLDVNTAGSEDGLIFKQGFYYPEFLGIKSGRSVLEIPGFQLNMDEIHILRGQLALAFTSPEMFSTDVVEARKKAGRMKLLYLPGGGLAHMIPLFVYMGIDLMDTSQLPVLSSYGLESHPFLGLRQSILPTDELLEKNRKNSFEALTLAREYMSQGRLRELVERTAEASPEGFRLLSHLDRSGLIGGFVPEASKSPVYAAGRFSFNRPDIIRWVHRIRDEYIPPKSHWLIILPCSAKKPYSRSRSHRKFRYAMGKNGAHEIILTSPLGVVPRELEATYPAANYDIPVVGRWYPEEKERILTLLEAVLDRGAYKNVIVHFDADSVEGLRDLLDGRFDNIIYTVMDGKPTSQDSIASLKNAASSIDGRAEFPVQSLASYQFGSGAYKRFEGVREKGRGGGMRFYDANGRQVAAYSRERGLLALTVAGAELLEALLPQVNIEGGFEVKNSILAPGIISADPNITPGSEVAVVRDGKLLGVGQAVMSGTDMVVSVSGMAVKVRSTVK